ncbi:MAG TPA: SGNH/GDSL hydrolase family protein [Vicinamibacteria bacterium]|nr:SGNH/GDSL hydrolase family protein [Vicinamibacteria bacterium]
MSSRRAGLRTLALTAASVALTLLALEAAFRVARVPVGTVQINRATVRRSDNPRLRFELRPGGAVRAEVEYHVNELGLRGPETTLEKPPGVRRVAVLGDSIAFGYWVSDEQGFARQLERLLNQAASGAGRVEVLNFGVPGYNLEQEIEALRAKALAFSPDLVVVLFCLNDLEGLFSYELGLVQERTDRRRTLAGRVREWLVARSRLFSWVEYRLTELEARRHFVRAKNPLEGPLYAEAVSEQGKALQGQLAVLRSLLASRGIPGLVVVVPVLGERFERYPHRELHAAVVAAADSESLAALDLVECFAAYEFRDLRVDVVHPSPLGHRVAAHAVRDALCARGWLCAGVPAGASCRDYRPSDFATLRGY